MPKVAAVSERVLIGRRSFVQWGSRPHVSKIEVNLAADYRAVVGWRDVPGGRQIGQRLHRAEDARDGLGGQETGVAAAHGRDSCCAVRRLGKSLW